MNQFSSRNRPSILIVGTFLSEVAGNRGVCEDLAVRLRQGGYRVITTSARRGRLARLSDMLSTCWKQRLNYDVAQVDVYSGPAFFWAESVCWTLRRLGKPYILTLHGGRLPEFAGRCPQRVRRLLQSAALVTAPSRYLQQRLQPFRPDIALFPNALDMARYTYRLRTVLKPNLVWLRAFHRVYNPTLAVEVAGLLKRSFPSLTLTMAGPDKSDGSLDRVRKMSAALKLDDVINLPGRVPKSRISELINANDIFINTTNADNTPVSVLEAMACGACVVSTDVGGLKYLLDHEQNALLVAPDDPHAMAAAVGRLMNTPELSRSLSECARRTCEDFDWPGVLNKWELAFNRVALRSV